MISVIIYRVHTHAGVLVAKQFGEIAAAVQTYFGLLILSLNFFAQRRNTASQVVHRLY